MTNFARILPLALGLWPFLAWGAPSSSTLRPDLATSLGKALCDAKGMDASAMSPQTLWGLGVYDAQMEGQSVTFRDASPSNAANLQRAAHVFATRNGHYGAASGVCPNGKGWVVTTPGPAPLKRLNGQALELNNRAMAERCERVDISYAAAQGGAPRRLRYVKRFENEPTLNINLALLGDGTLAVTCHPTSPSWQGPVMWYLYPVGQGPAADVPEAQALQNPKLGDAEAILAWANAVRAKNGLPAFYEGHPQVQTVANDFLAKNGSLRHDRRQFRAAEQQLRKIMGRFVGENRVKGRSRGEMAWLLWNSPDHRGLILSKEATHLAVAAQNAKGENIAVMVTAKF